MYPVPSESTLLLGQQGDPELHPIHKQPQVAPFLMFPPNGNRADASLFDALKSLFEEAAAGGRWDRPELHIQLDHLREGDTVVVWKLDGLLRSLKDALDIMEQIAAAGAGLQPLTEVIDTTRSAGRMMMQIVAAFAGFERAMIRERMSAGLAADRVPHHRPAPHRLFS